MPAQLGPAHPRSATATEAAASPQPRYEIVRDGACATIRFEHAPTRNALDWSTRFRLIEDLADLDAARDVRVIVLTGADPTFTSGVDAKQLFAEPGLPPLPVDPATRLRGLRTPTIAAVNGPCISGGLEVALACSFIVASDRAVFADTHARLGLSPGWGLSAELPSVVGIGRARQLTFTGLPIDAATAFAWGLVNEVVAHERLFARVAELAHAIAAIDERSVGNAVGLYRDREEAQLEQARARELEVLDAWTLNLGAAEEAFRRRGVPPQ